MALSNSLTLARFAVMKSNGDDELARLSLIQDMVKGPASLVATRELARVVMARSQNNAEAMKAADTERAVLIETHRLSLEEKRQEIARLNEVIGQKDSDIAEGLHTLDTLRNNITVLEGKMAKLEQDKLELEERLASVSEQAPIEDNPASLEAKSPPRASSGEKLSASKSARRTPASKKR